MEVKKKFTKADLIPAVTLLMSVVGTILVACHVLSAGMVFAAIGLAGSIYTRVAEKKLGLNEVLAYWAEMLGIVLFIVCCFGFLGYSVWDYVASKDLD